MDVPHEGGRRFRVGSEEYRILRSWIASGMPADSDDAPELTALKVEPRHATIYSPDVAAKIRAIAEFSDGQKCDVTNLAVYASSVTFVSISDSGVATADRSGLTTVTVRYLDQQVPVRLEFVPERPNFVSALPAPTNFVDELVFKQLARLKINPSELCDDTVFLRRAYLDLTGLLPTINKAQQFVAASESDKRAKLIDELLGFVRVYRHADSALGGLIASRGKNT
jgi:hypothetical protein